MTESPTSPGDAAAQRASEQIRIRKERREAKLKAGGSARLNKISGLSGGIPRDPEPTPVSSTTGPSAPAATPSKPGRHADPDESRDSRKTSSVR
ncbi:hypothetical protein G7046_g7556 [Stylonectria norvegica]|nr:hypothetical protein G7046_g7556 [Stylonectria norvegica]